MVKGFFLTLGLFLFGIIASIGVILLIGTEEIAKALEKLDVTFLIPVGVLLCIEACISTFRWKYILDSLGEKVPMRNMIPIWLAGNAFNYLSPVVYVGGEGIRIFLLKRRFNIPYYRGSASVFLDQIFNGLSVWPMVVFGFIIFLQSVSSDELNIFFYVVLIITVGIFGALLWGLLRVFNRRAVIQPFLVRFNLQHGRVGSFLIRMENEMLSFRNVGMKLFWNALLLSFARQATILIRTGFILVALGEGVGFNTLGITEILNDVKDTVITSTSIYVSYLVPIPLALGAQEASQAGVFEILGWSSGAAILFATIYRASEMVMVFTGVVILVRAFTTYAFENLWDVMKTYKGEVKKVGQVGKQIVVNKKTIKKKKKNE